MSTLNRLLKMTCIAISLVSSSPSLTQCPSDHSSHHTFQVAALLPRQTRRRTTLAPPSRPTSLPSARSSPRRATLVPSGRLRLATTSALLGLRWALRSVLPLAPPLDPLAHLPSIPSSPLAPRHPAPPRRQPTTTTATTTLSARVLATWPPHPNSLLWKSSRRARRGGPPSAPRPARRRARQSATTGCWSRPRAVA